MTFSHALTGLFCGFSFSSNKLYRKELCWQMVKQSSRVANFTLVKPPEGTLGTRVRVHVPWFEVGLGFVNSWPPKTISSFFIVRLGICSGRKVEKTFSILEIPQFFFQDKWLLLWLLWLILWLVDLAAWTLYDWLPQLSDYRCPITANCTITLSDYSCSEWLEKNTVANALINGQSKRRPESEGANKNYV